MGNLCIASQATCFAIMHAPEHAFAGARGVAMFVSTEDAVRIYAKACRSWYGGRARTVALTRAHELQQKGDLDGASVWRDLADEIERGQAPEQPTSARPKRSIG
jgi:hypothetical protein